MSEGEIVSDKHIQCNLSLAIEISDLRSKKGWADPDRGVYIKQTNLKELSKNYRKKFVEDGWEVTGLTLCLYQSSRSDLIWD